MNALNKLVVAALPAVPKQIIRTFASRYIAGEHISDAVRAVRELNSRQCMATLDVLGEHITRKEEAVAARDAIVDSLSAISKEGLDSNVSIKLTQLGLKLDKSFCLDNVRHLASVASSLGNFIRIDMEDSSTTDDTIDIFRQLRKEFDNIGIVLQAYLRRTESDAQSLIRDGLMNFRLCKGIYIEPEAVAFKEFDEINRNFQRVLRLMLTQGAYVGIATHDTELVGHAQHMVRELNLDRSRYEFQMLLGVRPELRERIVRDGHRMRVYVPFGHQWYEYSIRRFKENPKIAGYIVKALFNRHHYQ